METKAFGEYRLSRMMLGTVQFGMPYGIANKTGQPDYDLVKSILTAAADGGVNCIDTAAMYGTSEEVLGRALKDLGLAQRMTVVTKVRWLTPEELADPRQAAAAIEQSVALSRQRLAIDPLPIVLFHRECDAKHIGALAALKAKGWLRHAGVSCDNAPGPAAEIVALPGVSAVQIPANVLDPRHARNGNFAEAARRGVAVFIRSVYLQGLVVMPEAAIPAHLQAIVPVRRKLEAIAAEAGMTMAELAVRFMLGQAGVTCVLTGVETPEQVRQNIAIFNRGPLVADVLRAVDAAVPELHPAVLTPWMWPKLADKKP